MHTWKFWLNSTKTNSSVQLNSQERNLQELQMQRELKVRIGYRTKKETELKTRVNTWERKWAVGHRKDSSWRWDSCKGQDSPMAALSEKRELDKRHHGPRETFKNFISAWNSGLWGDGNETYEKIKTPSFYWMQDWIAISLYSCDTRCPGISSREHRSQSI